MLITQLHLGPQKYQKQRPKGAPPAPPPIINSKHKCASLINMKRQWGRTTLSPKRRGQRVLKRCGRATKITQEINIQVGRKIGLKHVGKDWKNREPHTPRLSTSQPGPLNLNKLHTFDFFSSTNILLLT